MEMNTLNGNEQKSNTMKGTKIFFGPVHLLHPAEMTTEGTEFCLMCVCVCVCMFSREECFHVLNVYDL